MAKTTDEGQLWSLWARIPNEAVQKSRCGKSGQTSSNAVSGELPCGRRLAKSPADFCGCECYGELSPTMAGFSQGCGPSDVGFLKA
jgi:hypothetical protein